jgi:hypothetical protein
MTTPVLAQDVTGRRLNIDLPASVQRLRFLDSNRLLVFGGDVVECDWRSGTVMKRYAVPAPANPECTDISPDGSTTAVGDGSAIRLLDSGTGGLRHDVTNASSRIFPCVFSPDGARVYFVTEGFRCKAWEIASGKTTSEFAHSTNLVVGRVVPSEDGRRLVTIINDPAIKSSAVGVWDARSGKLLREIPVDGRAKGDLSLSANGWRVALIAQTPLPGRAEEGRPTMTSRGFVLDIANGSSVRRAWELPENTQRLALSPDGLNVVRGGRDGTVAVMSVATGRELLRCRGLGGQIVALAFAPQGYVLAAADDRGTIHVWDLWPPPHGPAPSAAQLWKDLAHDETAFAAMSQLAAAPEKAIALFREHIPPAKLIAGDKLRRLLLELDDPSYAVRTQSATELRRVADLVRNELDKHASAPGTSTEARRHLRQILERIDDPTLELVVFLRALEVLERVGTPAARALVDEWAGGVPAARFTQEARTTLQRMKP